MVCKHLIQTPSCRKKNKKVIEQTISHNLNKNIYNNFWAVVVKNCHEEDVWREEGEE